MMPIVSSTQIPLHLGTEDEFALVRDFFQTTEFNDVTVCRLLNLGDMSDLGAVRWDAVRWEQYPLSLRWCVRIFLRGLQEDESESRSICGENVVAAFRALGLIRAAKKNPSSVLCPVWVYPVDGFVVATDRREDPDGDPFTPPEDVVFPAIYAGTLRFLSLLPDTCHGEALDLCGGSGIGALHLARTADVAVTADLTDRSSFFARFNSLLNGVNIESLCGDLYAPLSARQFDLITAHPPFVPATGPNMTYRDGGETGEEVTRRVVEGLPAHLRPGGTCVILCVARDTEGQTFEDRACCWLGEAGDEFDIVFGLEKILSVGEVVESMLKRGQRIAEAEGRQLFDRLQSMGTRQFVYGALFVRRGFEAATIKPCRVRVTRVGTAADFERLLQWRQHCRQVGIELWLAQSRPRFVPGLQLTVRHRVKDAALVPAEFVFEIDVGFHAALRPDGWVVPLLARLEGDKSVQEVFEAARSAEELPTNFELADFVGLVRGMIDRGFLTVEFS